MRGERLRLPAILFAILLALASVPAAAEGKWFASLYGGQVGTGSMHDTLIGQLEFHGSWFVVGVVGKQLATWGDYLQVEIEAQLGQHAGDQDHTEVNAAVVVRWLPFWWDRIVETSLGVGEGLSYAFQIPKIEADQHDETSKLLNYLMFDLEFAPPGPSPWSVFVRLHHRSGVDGLFDGVRGGSNALAVGVKFVFF